jgi:hypothetical protein
MNRPYREVVMPTAFLPGDTVLHSASGKRLMFLQYVGDLKRREWAFCRAGDDRFDHVDPADLLLIDAGDSTESVFTHG